jgi:hypothetical protein
VRNTYSPWDELAAQPHIELQRRKPATGKLGEYVHDGGREGRGLILLDPCMPRRQARSVLCHELRHAEAGDVATSCVRTTLRQEWLADTRAARLLVDVRDLADAMMIHRQHRPAVAVELHVSIDVVNVRLDQLDGEEWAYLRDRLLLEAA